ncbi:MAG: hypothetical protein FWD99_08455 [Oscillospiraceae bacterium]|nr:hypothetical protein [Oscillospiraceae bacterium]
MPSGFVISATWLGGGIWINEVSKRMKLTGTRYRKYIAIIANEGQKSIDAIASAMGVAYAVAVSDLQQMIDLGFLVDAHIDTESREIHLAKAPPPPREPETPPVPEAPVAQAQERVVACNGCGANKRVSAQVGECEYCGSPLQ